VSGYLPKKNKSLYPYKDLSMNVHGSLIWNRQNLETTQMPINERMDKQTVGYSYNGIYSAIKRNELLIYTTTWMSLKTIMLGERSQPEKNTHYIIPFM